MGSSEYLPGSARVFGYTEYRGFLNRVYGILQLKYGYSVYHFLWISGIQYTMLPLILGIFGYFGEFFSGKLVYHYPPPPPLPPGRPWSALGVIGQSVITVILPLDTKFFMSLVFVMGLCDVYPSLSGIEKEKKTVYWQFYAWISSRVFEIFFTGIWIGFSHSFKCGFRTYRCLSNVSNSSDFHLRMSVFIDVIVARIFFIELLFLYFLKFPFQTETNRE